jgi:hypothetical protein
MTAWRLSPVGVLIPAEHRPRPMAWPRPAGWDKLPADIRAAWDAPWRRVAEQGQGAR